MTLMTREDWKHAKDLIKILKDADQEVPQFLVSMAERYAAKQLQVEKELASIGLSGGRRGGRGGRGRRFY